MRSLKRNGDYFKHFLTATQENLEGLFYHRLKIMDTTTVFPFLLGLYEDFEDKNKDSKEKEAILTSLESYLIRRMICRLTTKNYNRFFLDLLDELKTSGEFGYERVSRFLSKQTSDTSRWPSNNEFREAWLNVPIYHAINRPRLRMILVALDKGLEASKTEPYVLKDNLTVEHLMPQLWKDHWPIPEIDGESYEEKNLRMERRNQLIQTIGNLFYLTKSLNPYVSNGPFDKKKKSILEHSAININRTFLANADTWSEDRILERSERLFDVALKTWPGPDEDLQKASESISVSQTAEIGTQIADLERKIIWDESSFLEHAIKKLGEHDTHVLKTFIDMAKSSPFTIEWAYQNDMAIFEMRFEEICQGSIIVVHANGDLYLNFSNMRGSEIADLFREILKDELSGKMELMIPDGFEDKTLKYSSNLWIDKGDTLMEILDALLEEFMK